MKKQIVLCLLGCIMALPVANTVSAAEMDIIIDARPGTLLLGNNTGRFKAEGPAGDLLVIEEAGGLSTFPSLRMGIGLDALQTYFDIMGDVGILLTDRFRAPYLGADASLQYKFRKNIGAGPHIGLMYFMTPEWSGSAPLDFSDSWGFNLGLLVAVGYDVQFVFAIDYVYIDPFKVTDRGNWTITQEDLDFTSLGVQFGIRGRF
ncbi:MAG: hypothetical protein KJ726_07750 [Verrucomicrobia bacterium]|nr:hypothetical protein [Verrucomicrobiota bacterium]MBU1909923.1 hypothetical protein [Verrucomicrobiota bacterium]